MYLYKVGTQSSVLINKVSLFHFKEGCHAFNTIYIYNFEVFMHQTTNEPITTYFLAVQAAFIDHLVLDGPQLWEEYQLFLMTFEKPATL